jgi:hypothetical protein
MKISVKSKVVSERRSQNLVWFSSHLGDVIPLEINGCALPRRSVIDTPVENPSFNQRAQRTLPQLLKPKNSSSLELGLFYDDKMYFFHLSAGLFRLQHALKKHKSSA